MYQVEWILENRIILYRAIGDVSAEAFQDGTKRLQKFIQTGIAPVYTISDGRYLKRFPASVSVLKDMLGNRDDKSGVTILIGGDGTSQFVSRLLVQFSSGTKPHIAPNLDEALKFLISIDESLPRHIEYEDRPPNLNQLGAN